MWPALRGRCAGTGRVERATAAARTHSAWLLCGKKSAAASLEALPGKKQAKASSSSDISRLFGRDSSRSSKGWGGGLRYQGRACVWNRPQFVRFRAGRAERALSSCRAACILLHFAHTSTSHSQGHHSSGWQRPPASSCRCKRAREHEGVLAGPEERGCGKCIPLLYPAAPD